MSTARPSSILHRSAARPRRRRGVLHARGGRRVLAPLAGLTATAALLAGCGAAEEPAEDSASVTSEESGTDDSGDGTDDPDGSAGDEDLFTGTWGFGHDTTTLDAEQLADLLEEEAEARGPAEMSLEVECGDGVDTGTQDYEAECIAYADEGVEHLWTVTVGPAGPGIDVEVANGE